MRAGISITLKPSDRRRLKTLTRDRNAPQKHVWRAEIVLLSANGVGTNEIVRQTGKSKTASQAGTGIQHFESSFYAANVSEWRTRYSDWVSDPILKEIYRARPMFDLRPILGATSLWQELEGAVTRGVNREFLHVLANDCLATLPPLTFF